MPRLAWSISAPKPFGDVRTPPCARPAGAAVAGLYSAWIILNNPSQYNSYTTEMVKAVIAGFPACPATARDRGRRCSRLWVTGVLHRRQHRQYAAYYPWPQMSMASTWTCSTTGGRHPTAKARDLPPRKRYARGWRSRNRHGHRPHRHIRPGCLWPGWLNAAAHRTVAPPTSCLWMLNGEDTM